MADIDVERKSNNSWIWWLIGLIILALLIWWLIPGEEEPAPVVVAPPPAEVQPTTVGPLPEPIAQAPGVPVSQIIESPATWTGRTLAGEVRVVEVPSDRGFWIEDQGERLFAIIVDQPQEQPKDINPGQTLRITEAVVRDPAFLQTQQIPGEPLDPETRRILNEQSVFLVVDEANINILGQNAGAGGTGTM